LAIDQLASAHFRNKISAPAVAGVRYPSLPEDAQGKINVAYSYNRKTIKVVRFDEEWITQGHTQGKFKGDSLR
jgi:predicted neuraminidase